MLEPKIDRMAITIAYRDQASQLLKSLNTHKFPVTIVHAEGGFLHEAMVTLVAGMPHQRLPFFLSLVREHCPIRTRFVPLGVEPLDYPDPQLIEVRVGGATVFVIPVEDFLQF